MYSVVYVQWAVRSTQMVCVIFMGVLPRTRVADLYTFDWTYKCIWLLRKRMPVEIARVRVRARGCVRDTLRISHVCVGMVFIFSFTGDLS